MFDYCAKAPRHRLQRHPAHVFTKTNRDGLSGSCRSHVFFAETLQLPTTLQLSRLPNPFVNL